MKKTLVISFIMVICLSYTVAAVWGEDIIKIGYIGPLSAPGAFESGVEMKMAVELAAEEINARGGLLGKKVVIVSQDTQALPEKGVAAMDRLITKEKVVGVVGEFHSSVAVAAAKIAHKYHIPFIGSEVWADEVTALGFAEVFRIAPANSLIYEKVADWIAESGFKNVVGIAENSDFGLGAARVITGKLREKRIAVSFVTAERTVTDFTPNLLKFKAMKNRPDLFVQELTGASAYALVKQGVEIGFAPSKDTAFFGGASDMLYPEFWEALGEYGKYIIAMDVGLPKRYYNIRTKQFIENFQDKYKRKPTSVGMEAYDSVLLLVEAIDNRASTDPDDIISALENIDYVGTRGLYGFSTSRDPAYMYHQFVDTPCYVFQYTRRGQTPDDAPILFPKKWATGKLAYPD